MGVSWSYYRFFRVILITILVLFVILVTSDRGSSETPVNFPDPKPHPLPPALATWTVKPGVGNYFSQVKESPFGYLVWSQFPIQVYLDLSEGGEKDWVEAVETAIAEWNEYLRLKQVPDRAAANIIIARSRPPLNTQRNPDTGKLEFSRARTARTRYEFDLENSRLIHRMLVEISPDQAQKRILATARHEMGHALGIWGHSNNKQDALYFSHVRDSPKISPRDINTLKKIYQQPTRLGWEIDR